MLHGYGLESLEDSRATVYILLIRAGSLSRFFPRLTISLWGRWVA